jgi:hypothetical protein
MAPTSSPRRRKDKKARVATLEKAPAATPVKAPEEDEDALTGALSPRQLRVRNRELLRAKATGTVKIPSSSATTTATAPKANRRIVFDQDDEYTATAEEKGNLNETEVTPPSDKPKTAVDPVEDDDDDAVEEVKTSTARESETKKRLQERESARSAQQGKKKRKRKKVETTTKATTDEFDEDFFQQLEEEKATEKARLKQSKLDSQPKGRYTSFVVDEEEEDESMPRQAEFDVQVAVIRSEAQVDLAFTAPSAEANIFSRNQLENGGDGLSAKQIQKAKKNGKKAVENSTWKRSTKMNLLLAPGRRQRGKGGPAVHFVKKK